MVKHIIVWKLKEEYSDAQKEEIKKGVKEGLESLSGKIPGMVDIKVNIKGFESSTGDLMLDSTFESQEALNNYSVNPLHQDVANTKVRPFTASRSSFDYEV